MWSLLWSLSLSVVLMTTFVWAWSLSLSVVLMTTFVWAVVPLITFFGVIPKLRRALIPRPSAAMSKSTTQTYMVFLSTGLTLSFGHLLNKGLGYRVLASWVIAPCLCLTYFGLYTLATTSGVSVNRVLSRGVSLLRGGGWLKSYLVRLTFHILWEVTEVTIHSNKSNFVVYESACLLISFLSFAALFGRQEDVLEFARLVKHHLSITVGESLFFGHHKGAACSFATFLVANEILRDGDKLPCGLDDPDVAKAEALEEGLQKNEGEEGSNKALKVVIGGGASEVSEKVVVRGGPGEASEIVEVDEDDC